MRTAYYYALSTVFFPLVLPPRSRPQTRQSISALPRIQSLKTSRTGLSDHVPKSISIVHGNTNITSYIASFLAKTRPSTHQVQGASNRRPSHCLKAVILLYTFPKSFKTALQCYTRELDSEACDLSFFALKLRRIVERSELYSIVLADGVKSSLSSISIHKRQAKLALLQSSHRRFEQRANALVEQR